MRKQALILVALVAAGLAGGAYFGLIAREAPLASGELVEALLRETDEHRQTEVFARFVPVAAPLEQQVPVLLDNGFRCGIEPAYVEGNSQLSCDRPIEGTGYCRGFRYFSYQTRTGEIIETLGSAYDRQGDRNWLGRCEGLRQHYYTLADEIGADAQL